MDKLSILSGMFLERFHQKNSSVTLLPPSGSSREYYRLEAPGISCIGTYNGNREENGLFINYSEFFRKKGCPVPEIYVTSIDRLLYLQEDLGNTMLLDLICKEKDTGRLTPETANLYRKALEQLLQFQTAGRKLDCSQAIPRAAFDSRCILWDLNYFKYCFLRLAGIPADEDKLENDFMELEGYVLSEPRDLFMFRDFQCRNIMIKEDRMVFIDYQGGRKGAPGYDVASLLYDAIAEIAEEDRKELLDFYYGLFCSVYPERAENFMASYYHIVLVRLLQAMGAFGLRGLYERKQHFIDSILPGLRNIKTVLDLHIPGNLYGEIRNITEKALDTFQNRTLYQDKGIS